MTKLNVKKATRINKKVCHFYFTKAEINRLKKGYLIVKRPMLADGRKGEYQRFGLCKACLQSAKTL